MICVLLDFIIGFSIISKIFQISIPPNGERTATATNKLLIMTYGGIPQGILLRDVLRRRKIGYHFRLVQKMQGFLLQLMPYQRRSKK